MDIKLKKNPPSHHDVDEYLKTLEKIKNIMDEGGRKISRAGLVCDFFKAIAVIAIMIVGLDIYENLYKEIGVEIHEDLALTAFIVFFLVLFSSMVVKGVLTYFLKKSVKDVYKKYSEKSNRFRRKERYFRYPDWTDKLSKFIEEEVKLMTVLDPRKNAEECISLSEMASIDKTVGSFVDKLDRIPTMAEYLAVKKWVSNSSKRLAKKESDREAAEKIIKAEKALSGIIKNTELIGEF